MFLAKPPTRAKKLVMVASNEENEVVSLGEWEKAEVAPILADSILELLDGHAQEMTGAVQATLRYLDAEDSKVTECVIKRQATHIENSEEVAKAIMQGDNRSVVVLANAQSLAVQRLYTQATAGAVHALTSALERSEQSAERSHRRTAELEAENAGLRQTIIELEGLLQQTPDGEAPTATTQAQERALKLLEQFAPLLMQKMLAASASGQQSS